MPTHTPSPHRFLAPKAPSTHSKPAPSGLRNVLSAKTPKQKEPVKKVELQFKKLTPAKQFIVAPGHARRKSGGDVDKQSGGGAEMRVQATPRVKPKRTFQRVESIEGSQSSPVATQGEDEGRAVVQSVELEQDETEDEDEMLFEPTAQHKRRRLSLPSSPPVAPQTPVPSHGGPSHRFKLPAPRTPAPFAMTATTPLASASTTTKTPASNRPAFILPALPTSPQKPSKSLPEIFSPSRKTGKYLPSGLAATATGWIIDMAGTSYAAQNGLVWGREREDGVKMRVRVEGVSKGRERRVGGEEGEEKEVECYTGSVVFVRGSTEPGLYNASRAPNAFEGTDTAELRILLAGQGGIKSVGGVKVKVGSVVGIRQPLWDIAVANVTWVMAVDWVVLS